MDIKINTNISKNFNEISININAPELSDELQNVIEYISNLNGANSIPKQIIANKDNEIHFIDLDKAICFFSKDKYNYVRTKEGVYKVKYKLYELEELLKPKDFIRISNSCIINIHQVEYFDTSILGTIFAGNIQAVYFNSNLLYFYIGYTVIFILMYTLNYFIGKKMTKELNQSIKKNN